MFTNLLTILILWVFITFWDFDFCPDIRWKHTISVSNHKVIESYIEVCNWIEDTEFTVIHELWHNFWYVHMSIYEREQYELLQSDFILDYYREFWMSKPTEDFSDNFANIILGRVDPNGTENYRNKIKFIRDLISKYE